MKKERTARKVTVAEGVSVLVFMATVMCVGSAIMGFSVQTLMTICCAFTLLVAYRCGWTWSDFANEMKETVGGMVPMFMLILGIGFLIGGLCYCGTVPVLVMWLANAINAKFILFLSFLLPGIMSYCIGSNFAPTGTIGVIMFSVAQIQGIPLGLVAAAVLSGANIGQYMSPLADNPNMVAGLMNVSVYDLHKKAYSITVPSVIVAAALFLVLGLRFGGGEEAVAASVAEFATAVQSNFNVSILVLIPLIMALVLSFLKVNSVIMLYASGIVAYVMGLFLQPFDFNGMVNVMWNGFSTDMCAGTITDSIAGLVNRGGMNSMSSCVIFTTIALVNVSMIKAIGALDIFGASLFKKCTSRGSMTLGGALFTTVICCATTDTYPSNVIATSFLKEHYEKAGIEPAKAAAMISIITNSMCSLVVPWSFGVIYCTGVMGVGVWEYMPYSFLAYALVLFMILFGYLGIGYNKNYKAEANKD